MKDLRGYFMIMGAAVFWGVSATAAKILLNRHVDTLLIVQCRVTFSSALFLLAALAVNREILRTPVADLWRFGLLGILGVAGANFTYYFAIKETTVATAILLQYTAPLAVMAYAAASGEEELSAVKVGAAVLSLLGCFFAVGAYDPSAVKVTPLGLLSAAGSMLCFAFLSVYTRRLLVRHNVWTTTFYSMVFASVFWSVLNPPWAILRTPPSPETWLGLFVLAIVSVLIPHTLFFAGLRHLQPTRAIITSTLEPIVAITSAAVVLGEYLEPLQALGAILVMSAIVLLQVKREPVASGTP